MNLPLEGKFGRESGEYSSIPGPAFARPVVITPLDMIGSESFEGEPIMPTQIFRASEEAHYSPRQPQREKQERAAYISPLQLANPIMEASSNDLHERRVISPLSQYNQLNFPVLPEDEAMSEGGAVHAPLLSMRPDSTGFGWCNNVLSPKHARADPLPMDDSDDQVDDISYDGNRIVDFSSYFQSGHLNEANAIAPNMGECCEDFSISSHEASSIEDVLSSFEQADPDAFWEEAVGDEEQQGRDDTEDRCHSHSNAIDSSTIPPSDLHPETNQMEDANGGTLHRPSSYAIRMKSVGGKQPRFRPNTV
jgi:hypothetical protein